MSRDGPGGGALSTPPPPQDPSNRFYLHAGLGLISCSRKEISPAINRSVRRIARWMCIALRRAGPGARRALRRHLWELTASGSLSLTDRSVLNNRSRRHHRQPQPRPQSRWPSSGSTIDVGRLGFSIWALDEERASTSCLGYRYCWVIWKVPCFSLLHFKMIYLLLPNCQSPSQWISFLKCQFYSIGVNLISQWKQLNRNKPLLSLWISK